MKAPALRPAGFDLQYHWRAVDVCSRRDRPPVPFVIVATVSTPQAAIGALARAVDVSCVSGCHITSLPSLGGESSFAPIASIARLATNWT